MPRGIVGPLAVLAGVALLCVTPLARAALPGPVKQCKYTDSTTADKPCTADLYVGQHMTYECGTGDTPGPAKANAAGGNYCSTPLEDTGDCAKAEVLDADIGTTAAASNVVTLRLKEDYTAKFKDVIKFHVRCVKAGGDKIFVAVTLWPFMRPLTVAPTKKTCANATDTGTTYLMRCNFYIFKSDPSQDFDCADSGTPTTVPANAHDGSSGTVCATGFKNASVACAGDKTVAWTAVAPGATIAAKNSNQTIGIATSSMTVKRAVVYIGCKRGSGSKDLFAKGMLFNEDFTKLDDTYVKMIKHVCTPEKGKAVDTPCEVALAANEAVVMVCTPFVTEAKYKLMPDDTNTKNGKFCTSKPAKFDADCTETKKWVDDAKAVVSMDASMDFFLVALPKANADQLKTQVVAYGYCSDETNGLAWKITLGTTGSSSPTTTAGPSSSAAPPTGNTGVAVGFLTLVAASFVAAAAM